MCAYCCNLHFAMWHAKHILLCYCLSTYRSWYETYYFYFILGVASKYYMYVIILMLLLDFLFSVTIWLPKKNPDWNCHNRWEFIEITHAQKLLQYKYALLHTRTNSKNVITKVDLAWLGYYKDMPLFFYYLVFDWLIKILVGLSVLLL